MGASGTSASPGAADDEETARGVRRTLLLAHASAAVSLGGVQALLPALPAMQRALDLNDAQIGLVNSAYLLPSVILAVPAGLLADRVGRRVVHAGAMALFGLTGALMFFVDHFGLLLGLRTLQGAAFAAILPISVTLLGDVLSGPAQVREQGWRMFIMTSSDTVLALLGGALVLVSWNTPFVLHVLALPLAVAGWRYLPRGRPPDRSRTGSRPAALFALMRTPMASALSLLGFLRFLFKFAVLTYSPILLDGRGWSGPAIAVALAGFAGAGVAAALATRWLVRVAAGSTVLLWTLVAISAGFLLLGASEQLPATVAALALLGAAEGSFGVVVNAMTLEGVGDDQRGAFVSAVGAFRNLGKFLAPSLLGLAVLRLPLADAFVVVGALAFSTLVLVRPLRKLDARLRGDEVPA